MYKKLRTFRFCAAIMSPGCPPPAVPAVCCPQYPPLPVALCPPLPAVLCLSLSAALFPPRPVVLFPPRLAALRLRYPPSVACGSRRLLPFLLRGLMPSACGTRCQPVACDCRPPVTRCARFCLLSSVLRGLPPSAWGTRRPPVAGCACFCPLPGAVRCLPGLRGRAAVRKKAAPDRDGSARVQYARSLISWRLSCPLRRAR